LTFFRQSLAQGRKTHSTTYRADIKVMAVAEIEISHVETL